MTYPNPEASLLLFKRVLVVSAFILSSVALADSNTPNEQKRPGARQRQMQCQRALYGTYEQMGSGSAFMEPEAGDRDGSAFVDDGGPDDRGDYPQF